MDDKSEEMSSNNKENLVHSKKIIETNSDDTISQDNAKNESMQSEATDAITHQDDDASKIENVTKNKVDDVCPTDVPDSLKSLTDSEHTQAESEITTETTTLAPEENPSEFLTSNADITSNNGENKIEDDSSLKDSVNNENTEVDESLSYVENQPNVDDPMEGNVELNASELLENPAEVNINENADIIRIGDENENDAIDPMDTTDTVHEENLGATELDQTDTQESDSNIFDAVKESSNAEDETDDNANLAVEENELNPSVDNYTTNTNDSQHTGEDSVADIEEGKGADEEISLLPEREISEADKERAILLDDELNSEVVTVEDNPANESEQSTINDINNDANIHGVDEEEEPEPVSAPKDFEIKDTPTPLTVNPCFRCNMKKQSEFFFVENDENRYICTINCVTKLRNEKPDQFTLNLKKVPIFCILETKQKCVKCRRLKLCNYRLKNKEKYDYLCDNPCLTNFMGNIERYVVKKKRYLIDESTITNKENKCIQCSETKMCKYMFKQEEDDLFICHEDCLNLLLKEQPDKIRVKRRSVRVRELPLRTSTAAAQQAIAVEEARPAPEPVEEPSVATQDSSKIVARSEQEAEDARQERELTFMRRCTHCTGILNDTEKLLNWETLDFCNEICLGQYQNIIGATCTYCNSTVSVTSLGKYCVRFGYDIKQFCRSICLNEYKTGLKVCAYCQKDISAQGFLAPVGDKGQFKDFCTQNCMKQYDEMCNPRKKSLISMCAVCNNEKPVRVEVLLETKIHKFCSNPCFSAFKFVNNVYPDQCQMCQKYFERKRTTTFTIYQNTTRKMFCSKICMNIYIITNRKIVPCNWCKVKKYNFDMISKIASGQSMMMCSLNCLTLCKVSMNAISMTTLKCDQCNIVTVPQYLLSMSDASIRNFCTYQCVMSFQSQFSKAPLVLEGEAAANLPIPTGLPKRVRKDTLNNQQQAAAIKANPTTKATQIKPLPATKGPAAIKQSPIVKPTPAIKQPPASKQTPFRQTVSKSVLPTKITQPASLPVITSVTSLAGPSAGITTRSTRTKSKLPTKESSTNRTFQELKVSLERIDTGSNSPAPAPEPSPPPTPPPPSPPPPSPPPSENSQTPPPLLPLPTKKPVTRRSQLAQVEPSTPPTLRSITPTIVNNSVERASPIVEIKTQVVVVPPIPKNIANMSTMCKPIMETKGINCKPKTCTIGCQTEDSLERKLVIPIPVPIYIPQPMYMYSLPMPIPVPFPIPIPIPVFIPTTRNSAQGIMKEIKKIQDKMPTDPFEAELLMMAEMVAGDKKRNESDSGSDVDDNPEEYTTETIENSNAFGEDMLQMALKMATELDEPAVDLESAMPSNTITPSAHPHIPTEELVDDPAVHHHHMLLMEQHRQLSSTRGRKRGTGTPQRGTSRNSIPQNQLPPNKKARREMGQIIEPQPEPSREPAEKADANMCLKFTFGVNAWKQWVMTKNADLEKSSIRRKPFKSDLLQLTADELNYSLCLFVKEVRKPNGSEYAPDTIYYLVLGIQQYLYEHGRIDNIFTDPYYEKFTDCLDEVARKFSVLYNDSQYIVTRVEEEHLWECKQLGAHSPHVLLSTLMFFNTKHFNLTTVEEHMQLSFSHIMKHWKRNPNQPGAAKAAGSRNVLLRFYPPQSSLDNNSRKKKVYEQQENEENPLRCPVKLYEFYLSKCPESVKTRNDVFYLQPERSCVPDSPVWYSTQALSKESLSKMLHRVKMVKEINIALLTS